MPSHRIEKESLEQKVARVTRESVSIVPYDPAWPSEFQKEKRSLSERFPNGPIVRVEHFGSTAIPGMPAKPIIDMLIEVVSYERVEREVVPVLEALGHDYFWRPAFGDSTPPFYSWFILRNRSGRRRAHLHMVEAGSALFERLLFRDYLIAHKETADAYAALKSSLSARYSNDRVAYTAAKTRFINEVMEKALEAIRR